MTAFSRALRRLTAVLAPSADAGGGAPALSDGPHLFGEPEVPVSEIIEHTDLPPVAGTQVVARRLRVPAGARRAVALFDHRVDGAFDRVRGNRVTDRVLYTASELGEFSLVWHLIGLGRGLRPRGDGDAALRFSGVMALESVLVNGVIKSFFRRERPEWDQPRAHKIRKPLSSSFPSGHASAGMCAASLLGYRSRTWPLYYVLGALVGSSRVYVKIHHPSDVVGGMITGLAFGRLARRALHGPAARPRRSGSD